MESRRNGANRFAQTHRTDPCRVARFLVLLALLALPRAGVGRAALGAAGGP